MRIVLKASFAALLALSAGSAGAVNLITNGGFEDPDVAGVFQNFSNPNDIPGWTLAADGTAFGGFTLGVDIVDTGWQQVSGSQSADIDGVSVLSQSFATTPGATYALSFQYSHNPNAGNTSSSALVEVMGASTLFSQVVTHDTPNSLAAMEWLLFQSSFVANSVSATISFAGQKGGMASALERAQGFGLDDVSVSAASVSAVPLPASALLLLGAVGALGALRRRAD